MTFPPLRLSFLPVPVSGAAAGVCPQILILPLNSPKTEFLIIGLKKTFYNIDNSSLNITHSAHILGFIFDKHFTYRSHHFLSPMLLSSVNSAVSNSYLDCKTVSTVVASIIHPKLDYCNSVLQSS